MYKNRNKQNVFAIFCLLALTATVVVTLLNLRSSEPLSAFLFGLLAVLLVSFVLSLVIAYWLLPYLGQGVAKITLFQFSDDYNPESYIEKGNCLAIQKRYEEAVIMFKEAIDRERTDHKTWLKIADIELNHLEDPSAAVQTLAESLNAQNWDVLEHLQLITELADIQLYHLGNRPAAESLYRFIEVRYGSHPIGRSTLENGLRAMKPKTESQAF